MQTITGSLTILNAHTPEPKVYWNGVVVPGITAMQISTDQGATRVVLSVVEDPVLAEMKAAGVVIKRGAV